MESIQYRSRQPCRPRAEGELQIDEWVGICIDIPQFDETALKIGHRIAITIDDNISRSRLQYIDAEVSGCRFLQFNIE